MLLLLLVFAVLCFLMYVIVSGVQFRIRLDRFCRCDKLCKVRLEEFKARTARCDLENLSSQEAADVLQAMDRLEIQWDHAEEVMTGYHKWIMSDGMAFWHLVLTIESLDIEDALVKMRENRKIGTDACNKLRPYLESFI